MNLQTRNKVSTVFSMASMTDIVFQLLIFFIILSTMVNPYGEKVDLPNSSSRTTESPTVSITIKADLTYYVNDKKVPPETVEAELLRAFQGKENRMTILYVDESVPTGFTINMFAVARKNNIDMVVATEPD